MAPSECAGVLWLVAGAARELRELAHLVVAVVREHARREEGVGLGLRPGTELRSVSSGSRSPGLELFHKGVKHRPLGPRTILDASPRPRSATRGAPRGLHPKSRPALFGPCHTLGRVGASSVGLAGSSVRVSHPRRFSSFEIPIRSVRHGRQRSYVSVSAGTGRREPGAQCRRRQQGARDETNTD